ncbi:MAG: hypothetical protein ABIF12_02240 [bacterium]
MLKITKFKNYYFTILAITTLLTNSPLFSFNQRETTILDLIQNNEINSFKAIETELYQFDIQEKEKQIKEIDNELKNVISAIESETNIEKTEILNKSKSTLIEQLKNPILELQSIQFKAQILDSIKQQVKLLKTGIEILDSQENTNEIKILSKDSLIDLNIYNTTADQMSLFDSINNTLTPFGKIELALELDINRTNINKLEYKTKQINELLNNEEFFSSLETSLQHNAISIKEYLHTIQTFKNTDTEKEIDSFMQDCENKFSYYIKPAITNGINTSKNKLKNNIVSQLITSSVLPTAGSLLFNGERLETIKNLFEQIGNSTLKNTAKNLLSIELIKKAFSLETYSNWKFYSTILTQFGINKFSQNLSNSLFKVAAPMALSMVLTKYFGLPIVMFNMATIPFHAATTSIKMVKNQYSKKQDFKNNILQKFYELTTMLSQLEQIAQIAQTNDKLKPLVQNIKNLVFYQQKDNLGIFLDIIKNIKNYEEYKNKDILQFLYKQYISIFIKMEIPEYKELITNALLDLGKIDALLSKAKACKEHDFITPNYIKTVGKPYSQFNNAKNPTLIQNPTTSSLTLDEYNIKGFEQDYQTRFNTFVYNLILAHIGLAKADWATVTPIDNILTMLNKNNIKDFGRLINQVYKLNNHEKSMIFINNETLLKGIAEKTDYFTYNTYTKLVQSLLKDLLPIMPNSYYFFTA